MPGLCLLCGKKTGLPRVCQNTGRLLENQQVLPPLIQPPSHLKRSGAQIGSRSVCLVAPYRAILRYYRCDTPYRAIVFQGGLALPQLVRYPPPWYLVLHRHICAIPRFATYRAIIVRYPTKTSTKGFCDTIAASIARYEKYRCWASKSVCGHGHLNWGSSVAHHETCDAPLPNFPTVKACNGGPGSKKSLASM